MEVKQMRSTVRCDGRSEELIHTQKAVVDDAAKEHDLALPNEFARKWGGTYSSEHSVWTMDPIQIASKIG
ncbi:hypothetical protein RB195_000303 [Necator americanus]|uniref:Uncharacterized protein n=1 Tax=Necator americanus TaxID=51031 RepID=A0ABR1DA48_NECAM